MVRIPDAENREKILRAIHSKEELAEDFDFKLLGAMTEGYPGSDLKPTSYSKAYSMMGRRLPSTQEKIWLLPLVKPPNFTSRVIKPSTAVEGKNVSRRHRQAVTALTLTKDDTREFAASKDGLLVHWDIESGQSVKYVWPIPEASTSGSGVGGTNSQSKTKPKRLGSKDILALAVSSDGRYLASEGLDWTVHLWDTRTREHIQVLTLPMSYPTMHCC